MKKTYVKPKVALVVIEDTESVGLVISKPAKSLDDAIDSSSSACFPDSLSTFASTWDNLDGVTKVDLLTSKSSGLDFDLS